MAEPTRPPASSPWRASPGDALAPPPTPEAPPLPMTSRWLWMAGLSVAARVAILAIGIVVAMAVLVAVLR